MEIKIYMTWDMTGLRKEMTPHLLMRLYAPAGTTQAFIMTWDDPGGFYDHVPPPMAAPAAGPPARVLLPRQRREDVRGFGPYSRLGSRVPVLVVSPWIPKGSVVSTPRTKPSPTSPVRRDVHRRHGQAIV